MNKDRLRIIGKAAFLALSIEVGSALVDAVRESQDTSYRHKTWRISFPHEEGDIYCYTDVLPENRVYTVENPDGTKHRWYKVDLNAYACDLPREGVLGLRTGEQVLYSGFSGSADVKEPLLEKLK